jgi:pSer/pThr/pTyr-binding forkhead associated (FHA) protein
MLELEIDGQRTPVPVGELVIGAEEGSGLRLAGPDVRPRHAVVVGAADGSASVHRADDTGEVMLNGVRLGLEPTPILHGDKLQVGAHEVLVTDPTRGGSTQFVSAADVARMAAATAKPSSRTARTAATGGRLVCLTDGREYTIGDLPITLGRDAGCEVVVPSKDVSRRHCDISPTPDGYLLIDNSTNGTWVNGERIEGQRLLARADIIRVGDHDFRFYADRAAEPPAGPAPEAAPEGAAERLSETVSAMPVAEAPAGLAAMLASPGEEPVAAAPPDPAPAPDLAAVPAKPAPAPEVPAAPPSAPAPVAGPAMATLLVRTGKRKGARLPIKVPVVNLGRADYNDIVIPDESVSGTHAKLQRREGVWMVVDNDSTNGTFVDDERVVGEAAVSPGAVIRLGDVAILFEPTDDHLDTARESGTKMVGAFHPPPPRAEMPAAASASPPPIGEEGMNPPPRPQPRRPPVVVGSPARPRLPAWMIPAVLVVVLAIVALVLLTR